MVRVPLEQRLRLLGVRVGTLLRADALPPPGTAPADDAAPGGTARPHTPSLF